MPFEFDRLAEYTDDAILGEIRRVAQAVPGDKLSIGEFRRHARVSTNTIRRRFGSWQIALQSAGLADRAPSSPNRTKSAVASRKLSKEDLVTELRRVAALVGRSTVTISEFQQHSAIGVGAVRSRFGSWHEGLAESGLAPVALGRRYSDEECYENLMRIWTLHGRPPQYREMNLPPSTVGGKAYMKRWGTWNKALAAFSQRVSQDSAGSASDPPPPARIDRPEYIPAVQRDVRDPPLGLRYRVLRRDRFRCCICGASPATIVGCELHVDHITPFSKGGKTVEENLRTLCGSCNLGKGNKIDGDV